MGIYVFKREVLSKLLRESLEQTDLVKRLFQQTTTTFKLLMVTLLNDREAFYEALKATKQPQPPFSFYDEKAPIYTLAPVTSPSKLLDCQVTESIIGEGCILKNCRIQHSVGCERVSNPAALLTTPC